MSRLRGLGALIDPDEIQKTYGAGFAAAEKYLKRAKSGIPSDRWACGSIAEALVAHGIEGHLIIIHDLTEKLAVAVADIEAHRRRTDEGMGVFDK